MTHIDAMKQMVAEIDALPEGLEGYFTESFSDALFKLRQAIAEAEEENALQALHTENERLGLYKNAYGKPKQCKYPDCPYPCMDLPDCIEQEPVATVTSETSAERTLKSLGYTDNGGEYWKPPLGAWPPQPKQEPVAMREALKKLARFLDVVRVYAQEIRPIHELETDKPLHWKAREIQDEVIRLINTIPQQEPIHWIAPNFEFLFSSTPQRTEQEPVIDKSAAIRIATALGWTPPEQPVPVQEPVGWNKPTDAMVEAATNEYDEWSKDNQGTTECIRAMLVKAMKATPPAAQRTWVGLTDEEIEQGCKESWVTLQAWQSAVWWAEAKLKQKNGY